MPITPTQADWANQQLAVADPVDVSSLQGHIDRELSTTTATQSGERLVNVGGYKTVVVAHVIGVYTAVGWLVRHHAREADYLVFKASGAPIAKGVDAVCTACGNTRDWHKRHRPRHMFAGGK